MHIVSFNINSIRAHFHQLEAIVKQYQPELILLQEIKVQDADFPLEAVQKLGYQAQINGQKGNHGVANLSRLPLLHWQKDLPEAEAKRLIYGQYALPDGEVLHVINGYFPQGQNRQHETKFPAKRQFYASLNRWLQESFNPDQLVLLSGDLNIAPGDQDIGISEASIKRWLREGKCSFLPEERAWLKELMNWGLIDAYRHLHPEAEDYSWFDYRSKGFDREPKRGLRIDLFLISQNLLKRAQRSGIDYQIRSMNRPSDHCPIWLEIDHETD